jgi:hypothetical protein
LAMVRNQEAAPLNIDLEEKILVHFVTVHTYAEVL